MHFRTNSSSSRIQAVVRKLDQHHIAKKKFSKGNKTSVVTEKSLDPPGKHSSYVFKLTTTYYYNNILSTNFLQLYRFICSVISNQMYRKLRK